ncbi:MAG: HAMP domain-containing sensor histidine kinase [Actinomycetota bacterium]
MAATVVLVALGLLAANISTYLLLRGSLVGRVDEQLAETAKLASSNQYEGGRRLPPGEGGKRGEHDDPRPTSLPVTIIEKLDPSGNVVDFTSFGVREVESPLVLPGNLPGSQGASTEQRRFFNAQDETESTRYRVLADAVSGGGTSVVAQPLADVDATLARLLLLEGLVSFADQTAAAGLALWLVRLGLQPLTTIEHTAAEIAAGDLSRRVENTAQGTEVGRLGQALNAMMERIEAAFEERRASESRLRRFIADASHELRTPLTSIRGYAELFRSGAGSNPEDLAKSMRRIEEESSRMGSLVEEMLLLARLDQDPQLEQSEVDLAALAADAVHDAQAVQPDRPIEIDSFGTVMVTGDEARLRQVASNLLSNALKHSPPDGPVRVSVKRSGAEAVLQVADEGPGLEPEQAARVFDRFYRVDEARSRTDGGAGLGLSIVAAIVKAHGGRVWLETSPGAGARFFVALKLAGSTGQPAV